MGADLIGYLVSVPSVIPAETRQKAKEYVLKYVALLEDFEENIEGELHWDSLPKELTAFFKDDVGWDFSLEVHELLDELRGITEEHVDTAIDFLVDPYTRDAISRPALIKDRRVIFAGDMSWGDAPEGLGYQTLDNLHKWGLWKILDIK